MQGPASRPLSVFIVALTLVSCSRTGAPIVLHRPSDKLALVGVTAMTLSFAADAYEAQLRTEDILATLYAESEWGVFGPEEFEVRSGDAPNLLLGTDLVLRAQALGVAPRQLALLRSRAAIFEASTDAVTTGAPAGSSRSSDYAAEVVVTLTLLDAQGVVIAEVESRRVLDPFADHPTDDARPEVRDATVAAAQSLVDATDGWLTPWPRLPAAVRANPAAVIGRAGRRQALLAMSELERDQEMLPVFHYFDPELPMAEAHRLFQLGGGFCLLADAPAALATDDCVVAIDGAAIAGAHALSRAMGNKPTVELAVARRGETKPRNVQLASVTR